MAQAPKYTRSPFANILIDFIQNATGKKIRYKDAAMEERGEILEVGVDIELPMGYNYRIEVTPSRIYGRNITFIIDFLKKITIPTNREVETSFTIAPSRTGIHHIAIKNFETITIMAEVAQQFYLFINDSKRKIGIGIGNQPTYL
jgi:hypothetical protein